MIEEPSISKISNYQIIVFSKTVCVIEVWVAITPRNLDNMRISCPSTRDYRFAIIVEKERRRERERLIVKFSRERSTKKAPAFRWCAFYGTSMARKDARRDGERKGGVRKSDTRSPQFVSGSGELISEKVNFLRAHKRTPVMKYELDKGEHSRGNRSFWRGKMGRP